ncbi:PIN domain-containing protein [Plectonema radiosum NIES-515]|uniref:PIN domain-containing protein n=1 Tax=Plectonema radiosum NIES-515 TaxID=2986073 RepID=A0ABT3AYR5_9CYAN|nr:PIN domain-containing protein [Plectonema radiosum]MCV3214250.1 PIN domain-containing protein [Plectonema radiosum NIES-515]
MSIVRRQTRSLERAKRAVSTTLTLMQVCTVDGSILSAAISSSLPDFEDAVQLACAISENLNAIITRDPKGFVGATVAILSPSEFLFRLSSDS